MARFFGFNKHGFVSGAIFFEFEKHQLKFGGGVVVSWELESIYIFKLKIGK
jgi:hypothetical protein